MVNGPPKNESLGKFYPSLGISQNFLMGLGVSDFVSAGHIFAFLLSHYTFLARAQILRCQSRHLGKSQIYHSPPLLVSFNTTSVIHLLLHPASLSHKTETTQIKCKKITTCRLVHYVPLDKLIFTSCSNIYLLRCALQKVGYYRYVYKIMFAQQEQE